MRNCSGQDVETEIFVMFQGLFVGVKEWFDPHLGCNIWEPLLLLNSCETSHPARWVMVGFSSAFHPVWQGVPCAQSPRVGDWLRFKVEFLGYRSRTHQAEPDFFRLRAPSGVYPFFVYCFMLMVCHVWSPILIALECDSSPKISMP